MKVRAIKDYYDLDLGRLVKTTDEPFEVTAARGKALTTSANKAGYPLCEEVVTPTAETAEQPIKKSRKKKEE